VENSVDTEEKEVKPGVGDVEESREYYLFNRYYRVYYR